MIFEAIHIGEIRDSKKSIRRAFRLFGFSAFRGHLKYGFIVPFQANTYPQKLRQNASNPQNYFYKKVS
jgi:hypothetical protein